MVNQRNCQLCSSMNANQSGFNYEIVFKRTLSSKTVDAGIIRKNKTMHSCMIQMTINTAGKSVGPLFLVLQEHKSKFSPIVMQKRAKNSTWNLFISYSTSEKRTQPVIGEYFGKIRESIDSAASVWFWTKWVAKLKKIFVFWNSTLIPVFLSHGTTNYQQPLDVKFFQN